MVTTAKNRKESKHRASKVTLRPQRLQAHASSDKPAKKNASNKKSRNPRQFGSKFRDFLYLHTQQIRWSQPISRVLSRTVIHLGYTSPHTSSNLPEPSAGRTSGFLFGLAPSGVYRATDCCQPRGALLPHPFTLTVSGLPQVAP
jgi:hypothetical protein